eukprot:gene8189-8857_t
MKVSVVLSSLMIIVLLGDFPVSSFALTQSINTINHRRRQSCLMAMRRSKFSKSVKDSDQPTTTDERKSKINQRSPDISESQPNNSPPLSLNYQPLEKTLPREQSLPVEQRSAADFTLTEGGGGKEMTTKERIFDVVSNVIVADFFLILGFLLWFVVGISTQSSQPAILHTFQGIFQPVVVPSLTVLMVGSLASGLLNRSDDSKKEEETNQRRRR